MLPALLLAVTILPPQVTGAAEYEQRVQWIMGTALKIQLPGKREDLDELFRACFAEAQRWDDLLSPWNPAAPLTRLSASAGEWVVLPKDVLDYLQRAREDARRTRGIFDITLTLEGSSRIEIDWGGSRARLPAGAPRLDPGGDGKGVALDAIATLLHRSGVADAFLDFGGSSFLALGAGPGREGWALSLAAYDGSLLGELILWDGALSVSSTVQRDHGENGSDQERFHLMDLSRGEVVRVRRSVVVFSRSATEAEVLSTSIAIGGGAILDSPLLEGFSPARAAIFQEEAAPEFRGGFEERFVQAPGTDRERPEY